MKTAKLIDFNVKEIPLYGREYIEYYSMLPLPIHRIGPDEWTDAEIDNKIVPVTRLCQTGKEDVYIAYTEEAEELLGIPVKTIFKEKEYSEYQAEIHLAARFRIEENFNKYLHATFWQRLKYLIKGRL